jgi:hypothetical protein
MLQTPPLKTFALLLMAVLLSPLASWAQRKVTILEHGDSLVIKPLTVLNSPYPETNLTITPDGEYLYFTSLRGGQSWSSQYMTFQGDSVHDGDIWFAQRIDSQWQAPVCLPYGLNTSQGEDEPNVAADGQGVYFQSWNYLWAQNGGPYYFATRNDSGEWSPKKGLGGGITEFFKKMIATDGMSIGPEGKRFLVAAGMEYEGNMDIYMSRRDSIGWSACKKLAISSPGNERSVFMAADGKTIYFASDGYAGLGGLDIFKTTLSDDNDFGEVINLGAPFNTPDDDYGFVITGDGKEAYFVRDGDIYFVELAKADQGIRPAVSPPRTETN